MSCLVALIWHMRGAVFHHEVSSWCSVLIELLIEGHAVRTLDEARPITVNGDG